MASAGVHVSVIASMVGHADGGALLLRKYRHLFPHEQRQAAAAFDRLMRGGVAPGVASTSGDVVETRRNPAPRVMGGTGFEPVTSCV